MIDVGRIAGQPRAGDAVLHDVEGFHHHARDAGAVVGAAEQLALQQLLHGAAVAGEQALARGGLGLRRWAAGSVSRCGTTVPRPHRSELTLTAMT